MQPQCQSQLILEVVFVTILFVSYLYDYFRPLLHLLLTIKFRRIYQHIVTAEAKNIEFTQFAVDMSHFFLAGKSCFLCARFQLFIIQLLNLVSVVIRMRKLNTGSISGQLTGVSLASSVERLRPTDKMCLLSIFFAGKIEKIAKIQKKINKCVSLLRLLSKF